MTVHIVSGYMRSGTSMMMRALEAGGLDAHFDPERDDRMNTKFGDDEYKPNEGGFYELAKEEYRKEDFPLDYDGKLIKALFGAMPRLPGHLELRYRIVFMVRDPEEIRQSYEAFFATESPKVLQRYEIVMPRILGILRQRRDVEVTEFQYRDVVDEPLAHFAELADNGWPIDPQASAEVVDPDLCRFRLESLEVGI